MDVIERRHRRGAVTRGPAGRAGGGPAVDRPRAGSGGDTSGHIACVEIDGPLAPFAPVRPVAPLDPIAA